MDIYNSIKNNNKFVAVVMTGGGSLFVSNLLKNGGASRVFLFADMLYSMESVDDYIGTKPEKYVSESTTVAMLNKLKEKVVKQMGVDADKVLCVAVNAVLTSGSDQRSGRENKSFISISDATDNFATSVVIKYDPKKTREEQEATCANNIAYIVESHQKVKRL